MLNALDLLERARLALILGRSGSLLHAQDEADVGMGWAWRILFNAGEHLRGNSVGQRSDMGLWFSDTVAYGAEVSNVGQ